MPLAAFGLGIAILFFALVQLINGREPLQRFIGGASLAAAWVMMYVWADSTGEIRRLPALANSDNAAILVSAPAFFLASLTILHEGKRPVRSYLAWFAVPVPLAVGSLVYNALAAPAVLAARGVLIDHHSSPLLSVSTLASDLAMTAAIVLALVTARRLHRAGKVQDRSGFRHQVAFLFAYLAASLLATTGSASANHVLYAAGCTAAGLGIVGFALSRTAVYYFARDRLGPRVRRKKPEWDESADDLAARLARLMEREAPYRDETLTLRRLAELLGEKPPRLSYYLNACIAKSFRTYVNELRLQAVCRDLLAQPRRPILTVAFDNGFNSKSSFNTLFYQRYGQTPKLFRREHGGGD